MDTAADIAKRPIAGTAEQDTHISRQLDLIEKAGTVVAPSSEQQTLIPDDEVPDPEIVFAEREELLQRIEEAALAELDNEVDFASLLAADAAEAEAEAEKNRKDDTAPDLEISVWQQDLVEGVELPEGATSEPDNRANKTSDPVGEGIVVPLAALKSDQIEGVYWREASVNAPEQQEIALSFQNYASSLALLDREQRKKIEHAAWLGISQDYLQLELVVIDARSILLYDSYEEEIQCLRDVLHYLEDLPDKESDKTLARAISALKRGKARKAEGYLAEKSKQPGFHAAAYYCGQLAERRVDSERALAMYRRALTEKPPEPRYLLSAALMARMLYHYDEALAWLSEYSSLLEAKRQDEPLLWAQAQRELGYTYVLRGQYKEAGPLYKLAMTTLVNHLGQSNPEMATSWYQIGEFQESLGEYEKAMLLYKKSLYILEKYYGPFHARLLTVLDRLGTLCMELEMEREAVYFYKRKVFILKKNLRPAHPQLALSLDRLAEAYRLQGQYDKAQACYQQSLLINKAVYGVNHPGVAVVYQELAKLSIRQEKPEEAETYQQKADAIFQKQFAAERARGESPEKLVIDIPLD